LLSAPLPPRYGYGSAYPHHYPDDADVYRGGYSYYVTYPSAAGTLPFFHCKVEADPTILAVNSLAKRHRDEIEEIK
jgi:hypothetical protein